MGGLRFRRIRPAVCADCISLAGDDGGSSKVALLRHEKRVPFPVRHFASIDSTNSEAQRLITAGEHSPLWLHADEQTAGRGRLERRWTSTPGNLYSTLIYPTNAAIHILPQLAFVVGLAVCDAVRAATPHAKPSLKWPNDCLIDGAKIAGILCEVVSQPRVVAVLGCGINVDHAPKGLAYPAISLREIGATHSVADVFSIYATALTNWLAIWAEGAGFATIRTAWLDHAIGLGETVIINASTGSFAGINEHGAILLENAQGDIQTHHAGDLFIASLAELRKDY